MNYKTNTEPMNEAYKMLDGAPSATGVSDAAKGIMPKTAMQDTEDQLEAKTNRMMGCHDINEAYAMLFESLAVIMKSK